MGRFVPLHSGLEFRLISNDSLLLLLVHLCLGDIHPPSHLTSLPQIRPDAHFAKGGDSPPHKGLGYQSNFVWWWARTLCSSPATGRRGGWQEELSPCPLGAITWLLYEQVPSRLQALDPAFQRDTRRYSSVHSRISSAGLLQLDDQEGNEENCLPASLALLLGYIMGKFPTASKPLAWLSNRLPDENSSDHSRNSSAGLLQMDEGEGDVENCRPSSLALLLDYIISKFPVAPKPLAQPSIWRFHVFGAAGFVQESSQRSSNIFWFDHVQFACASTQSKFVPRFCEGKSLSSIMPSVSKVMKVSHSPCQEWGLKVISQWYN